VAPEVPPALSGFIQKLLAKNPADRPPGAEAVVAELEVIASGLSAPPARLVSLPALADVSSGPSSWADPETTEAVADEPKAQRRAPVKRSSRRVALWVTLGLTALLLVTGLLASRLFPGAEPRGTLVVEVDEPEREIVVKQNGQVVRTRTRDRSFALPPGEYSVEAADPVAGLKVQPDRVALAKDGTERIRLWIDKPPEPKVTPPEPNVPTPEPKAPAPELTSDRKSAEALNPHAALQLKLASGALVTVKKGDALPAEDFSVTGIVFDVTRPVPTVVDEVVLPAVAPLRSLTHFQGWKTVSLTEEQVGRLSQFPLAKTLIHLTGAFELTPATLDALKRFPNLTALGARAALADDEALARLVREHPNLSEVILEDAGKSGKLSAQGLAVLTRLPLAVVGLSGSSVVDGSFVRLLAGKPKLWLVGFWDGPFGDDVLKELPRCGAVMVVLENTKVTDAGLEHLKEMASLRHLSVKGAKVTEAGAKKLAAALPLCRIDWDGGTIESKPQPELERRSAVLLNPHADLALKLGSGKELFVPTGTALPAEAFVLIGIGLPPAKRPPKFAEDVLLPAVAPLTSLHTLGVYGSGILALTESQVEHLARAPCAKTLIWLAADFELTPRVLDALKQFPELNTLGCQATTADDALLERLGELPKLKVLHLVQLGKEGKVTERGLKAIAKLPVLDLRLTHSPAANRTFLGVLPPMSTLRALGLVGSLVTDDDLRDLAACSQITALDLEGVAVTDAGLAHLAKMTGLTVLGLKKTKVTKTGVEKLAAALPKCQIIWDQGTIEPKKPQ
jgi:hypothetical protein